MDELVDIITHHLNDTVYILQLKYREYDLPVVSVHRTKDGVYQKIYKVCLDKILEYIAKYVSTKNEFDSLMYDLRHFTNIMNVGHELLQNSSFDHFNEVGIKPAMKIFFRGCKTIKQKSELARRLCQSITFIHIQDEITKFEMED